MWKIKINDLQQESIKAGLKINIGKTKEMRINAKNKNPIQIDGNIIENVENFTYLGSNVSIDGGAAKDVNLRIQKARRVFARMSNIWRANYLGIKLNLEYSMPVLNLCFYMDVRLGMLLGILKESCSPSLIDI
jgi:hypothetical protein